MKNLGKDIPYNKVVKNLEKLGYNVTRKNKHITMTNNKGEVVIVPNHKTLKSSTLKLMFRQANININDYILVM